MNKAIRLTALALLALALVSCVPGDGKNNAEKPAGFFMGVWHGWIAPVSLVWSAFNGKISVFEKHNTGFAYNLGFYLAIVGTFGGVSAGSAYRRRRR